MKILAKPIAMNRYIGRYKISYEPANRNCHKRLYMRRFPGRTQRASQGPQFMVLQCKTHPPKVDIHSFIVFDESNIRISLLQKDFR